MLDALEQKNAEARMGLDRDRLAQDETQFQQQEAQDMKERVLQIEGADRRSRRHADAIRPGAGGGPIPRPGGASPSAPDGTPINPDELAIAMFLRTRREDVEPLAQARMARAQADGRSLSREDAEWQVASEFWAAMDESDRDMVRRQIAAPPSSSGEAGRHEQATVTDEQHQVPGWSRLPNAPRLESAERQHARSIPGSLANVEAFTRQMEALQREMSSLEAAGAQAHILSERAARARALHEQLTVELRTIGNYGVPQAAELERMERLAPAVGSREWYSGTAANAYSAMRSVMRQNATNRMRYLGYVRSEADAESGGGSVQGSDNDLRVGGHYTHNGRRYRIRTQEQLDGIRQRLGGGD
jgi:phage host-nuclease inhibitor protein Gam